MDNPEQATLGARPRTEKKPTKKQKQTNKQKTTIMVLSKYIQLSMGDNEIIHGLSNLV